MQLEHLGDTINVQLKLSRVTTFGIQKVIATSQSWSFTRMSAFMQPPAKTKEGGYLLYLSALFSFLPPLLYSQYKLLLNFSFHTFNNKPSKGTDGSISVSGQLRTYPSPNPTC